jgi:hypothetical protein
LLAVCLVARPSVAQEPPSDEEHIRNGVALLANGQEQAAIAEFYVAWSIRPTPRARAQIALAHQALGEWVAAERGLDEALHFTNDPWIQHFRGELEGARELVELHLGWLQVVANAPGATLFVNDGVIGTLPLRDPVRVPAGTIAIEVRHPGLQTLRRTVVVAPSEEAQVRLELEPLASTGSPPGAARPPADAGPLPRASRSRPGPPAGPALADAADAQRRRLAALGTLSGAGLLTVAGFGAWRVSVIEAEKYNNDGECVFGAYTREQRCGSHRSASLTATAVEWSCFAASGAALAVGEWLLSSTMAWRPAVAVGCAPTGMGATCAFRF